MLDSCDAEHHALTAENSPTATGRGSSQRFNKLTLIHQATPSETTISGVRQLGNLNMTPDSEDAVFSTQPERLDELNDRR